MLNFPFCCFRFCISEKLCPLPQSLPSNPCVTLFIFPHCKHYIDTCWLIPNPNRLDTEWEILITHRVTHKLTHDKDSYYELKTIKWKRTTDVRWSPHNVWTLLHSELLVLQLMWRILCFNTGIAVYRKLVWSFSACVGRCICPFKNNSHQLLHKNLTV